MIKEFNGDIYFMEIGNSDGFYRNLPGYPSYICLNEKHQGNRDFILDVIIVLLEAGKTLTPRQKCQKQTFWLEGGAIFRYEDDIVGSLPVEHFDFKKQAPALAEFSRN